MKILIACEYSGAVRDAFIRAGHDAVSCDLLPTDAPGPHIQGDVSPLLEQPWDMLIAFPPCTYLCSSGMHWTTRGKRDPQLTEDALEFVRKLMDANIPRIAIENPIGVISSRIRKPDQIIQPWQFGHPESKATCLWLKGLPLLKPTNILEKPKQGRWENQCESGQNKLAPSKDRWKIRSKTYQGIADAMAAQWSKLESPLPTNCRNANVAENLGVLFTWNTSQNADALGQETPRTTDGSLMKETESFTEYVLNEPTNPALLMQALARR